jgi:hypothetical protein
MKKSLLITSIVVFLISCSQRNFSLLQKNSILKKDSSAYYQREVLKDTTVIIPGNKIRLQVPKQNLIPSMLPQLVALSENENYRVSVTQQNGDLTIDVDMKELKKLLYYKDLQMAFLRNQLSTETEKKEKYKTITKFETIYKTPWYFKPIIYTSGVVLAINVLVIIFLVIKSYIKKITKPGSLF